MCHDSLSSYGTAQEREDMKEWNKGASDVDSYESRHYDACAGNAEEATADYKGRSVFVTVDH